MKYVYLSYTIASDMPVYGGRALVNINLLKAISKGDSSNVYSITIENHWGTHIDCPAHFFENGLRAADYSPETWFFQKPFVLPRKLEENSLAGTEDMGKIPEGTDLLLIKSGFSYFRGTEKYTHNNPGLKPEVGIWLREAHPYVKAVGLDFISPSSYRNRALGRESHRAFLDPDGINAPILIIEDMDLSHDLRELREVWVAPLRVEGIDSAPCTVMGFIDD